MQIVPGPSPCLFSSSLTKGIPHPFLLHGVPGATGIAGSSSSSMAGAGFVSSGSTCDKAFGGADVVYVSFPPSVDDSATENIAKDEGLGSGALGAPEVCTSTFEHPYTSV